MAFKKKKNNVFNYRKYSYILLVIEIILFAAALFLTNTLNIETMSAKGMITISLDWAGMFVLIIILNSCIQGRKMSGSFIFVNLSFLVFLSLVFDVGAWAVDKKDWLCGWNYFYNIGVNSMMLLGTFCFLEFVYKALDIQKRSFPYWSSLIVALIGIVSEIANIWLRFYYFVDHTGTYVRMTFGSLIGYIPFVYVLGCCGYLVWGQPIKFHKKLNYYSYIVVPFVISIWYTLTGLPPSIAVAPAIGVLFIYANIYVNMGKEMEAVALESLRKDVELAWQRNQIILSQIKPHFIFNCLGSIEELCRLDAEKARNAVHHFSGYLRANMDSISDKYLIPFSNEWNHIRNYVWLEQMRFEDDLEFQEEVETTDFSIPPLSIQPLVENAIKHGMMGMEEGVLTVTLSVKERDTYYEITIKDNGAGFDPSIKPNDGRSHVGIQNVRESLKFKVNGTLQIETKIGKGTCVSVCIPKEVTENEDLSSR